MEGFAEELFEWRASDAQRKPALINNAVKQLREVLQKRNMVSLVDSLVMFLMVNNFKKGDFWIENKIFHFFSFRGQKGFNCKHFLELCINFLFLTHCNIVK